VIKIAVLQVLTFHCLAILQHWHWSTLHIFKAHNIGFKCIIFRVSFLSPFWQEIPILIWKDGFYWNVSSLNYTLPLDQCFPNFWNPRIPSQDVHWNLQS
jgi:hypothetical protein